MKKLIAALLTVAVCAGLMGGALAKAASFPDITDADLEKNVAVLQMLGIIQGDDKGNFSPNGKLTRAQFCKMAVVAMGRGSEEALYRNRTIFPDVRSTHWARGYINLAVSGDNKIIIGNGDGTFRPDAPVTSAQAVTMLMRLLGYADSDAGMLWPAGYMALARETGLTTGISLPGDHTALTRAQAARLYVRLLTTEKKGGGSFMSGLGTATGNVVVMQLNVMADGGTAGAIRTSQGVLKTVNGVLPPSILGLRGTLLVSSAGQVLTFVPDNTRQVTVTAAEAGASWLTDVSGVRHSIPILATVYTATETTTYGEAFIDISPGMRATLYYSGAGAVEAVYLHTSKSETALVAGDNTGASTLLGLTGGDTGYTIVKNGAPATISDIRKYDVLTYDAGARRIGVSDFRLTAYYEDCWPSPSAPARITLMGTEFNVLPSAVASLAQYRLGQTMTVLFTEDFQVAGAVTGAAGSTAVGVVQPDITSSLATVKLLSGLTVSGRPGLSDSEATRLSGGLVAVSSSAPGTISLSSLPSSSVGGTLDTGLMTLGRYALSPAVKVFERVGTGGVTQIRMGDLMQAIVRPEKVLYAQLDYAGRVGLLVLEDVTGDRYTYGILRETRIPVGDFPGGQAYNRAASVVNGENPAGTASVVTGRTFPDGVPGGIAYSADGEEIVAILALTEVKNVSRSAFSTRNGATYLEIDGGEFPVAANVACYNRQTRTWFKSLSDARAFAETLAVYYDRVPGEGGKIRMVIVG